MELTIIAAGRPPAPLEARFGDYPAMFEALLSAADPNLAYRAVDARGGALPDPARLEAILITGSAAGVYEKHDWIAALADFVRQAHRAGTPMVGICFGHQIMAEALGGKVERSERGWGIGRHEYAVDFRPSCLVDAPATLAVPASHQDQVVVAPPGTRVVLHSPFAPFAGLWYESGRAISFQPHPEFTPEFAAALYDLRHRPRAGDAAVDAAIASLSEPLDNAELGTAIASFLRDASDQPRDHGP